MLYGRERERAELATLVERARAGRAGVLVVLGEPGVGKSALMHDLVLAQRAVPDADALRVLRTTGVESESPMPFAALHRLLRPVVDYERLPVPQARALRLAFGLEDGPPVEPFLVGMATLSVLTDAAEGGTLLCVIDDAQWLDSASADALLFAARQLDADPVVMVFAARYSAGDADFSPQGLSVLELGGLEERAARQLLGQRSPDVLPDEVADRLVRDSGGNPLALLELPTTLSPAQLYGAAPLPQRVTLTAGLERAFLDRCRRLSNEVQTLLLVAAADDTGRADTVRAAASRLGAQIDAWEDAERAGLLTVTGDAVAVRHPLVRSAVYQAATSFACRRAHLALSDALRDDDPDRATWHAAAAAEGPDERLAEALYQVGGRAEQRGGYVAAAAAFERAAALTVDGQAHAMRLFAAARNAWASGQAVRARALCASARQLAGDGLLRADIDRLRARIEVNVGSASDAHRIFVQAARAAADLDLSRALEMAVAAALTRAYGGDSGATLADGTETRLLAATLADLPRTRCLQLLLGALSASAAGDWSEAAATLERAVQAGRQIDDLDVLGNLGNTALSLGDDEAAHFFYATMVSSARESGAGMAVIYGLERLAFAQLLAGQWAALRSSVDEALTLARGVGQPTLTAAPLAWLTLLAALAGTDDYDHHLGQLDAVVAAHSLGILTDPVHDLMRWAKGTRATAGGDSAAALHHLGAMRLPVLQRMAAVDRVGAATRAGDLVLARAWVDELAPFATATHRPWAQAAVDLGLARCADAVPAAELYEQALGHYRHAVRPYDHARTHLLYGEFLRRTNRRVDARNHLRSALETFTDLGAQPLAARAAQELRASGETARKRDPSTLLRLTPMETKIAQLVSTGLSNKDVAAQCWVSPRTVAFHLRNVFAKVGVSSRGELAQLGLS
ncbi:AAA family ATPase [Kribbella sp. NPDC050241]|uniref:helix-turn-helix transcriptional regulator n=1 Tax=Kribbella sp. NPDC050241 TaxID=3364115 RepID=UPI0037BDA954